MDPIMSQISPFYNIGAASEKFIEDLTNYASKNPDNILKSEKNPKGVDSKQFRAMSMMKFYHSMAHAGESVGLIAAQSIGEPSTQMTLNTFHLAGRGDVNVTLGIPRLRELLMTGSKEISTPGMTLPLKAGATEKDAEELSKRLGRVQMSELVTDVHIDENLEVSGSPSRLYKVKIQLKSDIKRRYGVSHAAISTVMDKVFLRRLCTDIKHTMKDKTASTVGPISTAGGKQADIAAAAALAHDEDAVRFSCENFVFVACYKICGCFSAALREKINMQSVVRPLSNGHSLVVKQRVTVLYFKLIAAKS